MKRALDLFCSAGGATRGLQMAGFHVTGVDLHPQPRYCGDAFIQGDALTVPLDGYDLIWASPPCQGYSEATPLTIRERLPRLIPAVRQRLQATGTPYVIENVAGARRELINPIMLCGTMFELPIWRHRYFEMSHGWFLTSACHHTAPPVTIHSGSHTRERRGNTTTPEMREAMGIDWMTKHELFEAIPPAYSYRIASAVLWSTATRHPAPGAGGEGVQDA